MTTDAPTTTGTGRRVADARSYWRVLLAVVAPLGFLVVGVQNVLTPYELGGSIEERIADIDADRDLVAALAPVNLAFVLLFVPGALAMVAALRRRRPVFTAVMGTWMMFAGLSATSNPPTDSVIAAGLRHGLDDGTIAALVDDLEGSVLTGVALLPFLLLLTVGRIALGVLFWTAQAGPRWLAVLMIASPFVEFLPLGLGNAQPALSWMASGVAMTYVSISLLRTSDDEFDLPPTGTARVHRPPAASPATTPPARADQA